MFLFFSPIALVLTVIGYVVMFLLAATIAPKVAGKLSGTLSLYSSMVLTLVLIIFVFSATLAAIIYAIQTWQGVPLNLSDPSVVWGFIVPIMAFVVIANLVTYLVSPFMINLFYGATPDPRLQEIVNRVAQRLGVKPPKAVRVRGPPNAFAYGNIVAGRYVAVTEGMMELVDQNELEAVIGHEIGHHKHRDNAIMLFLGVLPSVIYYLGVSLVHLALWGGNSERRNGSGNAILAIVGIAAVMVSFVLQILILTFSRLREYYADLEGARAAGKSAMQAALAKIHIFYHRNEDIHQSVKDSKMRALFIYALTDAVAEPFYRVSRADIERIMRSGYSPIEEILATHPPIPKRLRFLENLTWI
ncbi:MAG TPA: zinc metalloprotease HtpX [Sulfolobales archaeon]|nr:zinc metalloprotease HtpX [Sulfolobales archaeon]